MTAAAITGLGVDHQTDYDTVSWTPVTLDTEGHAIQILAYRVYTGTTPTFALDVASSALTEDPTYTQAHALWSAGVLRGRRDRRQLLAS